MPIDDGIIGLVIGFGLVVVVPLVVILTMHQRKMTELIHKNRQPEQNDEILARLDAMQRQLEDVRNRQNELILQRHEQLPPPSPKVEDRIQE